MSKYKSIFYKNSNKNKPYTVGVYETKEKAIEASCDFVQDNSYLSSIEDIDTFKESLDLRGYYLFLNPWELELEEV